MLTCLLRAILANSDSDSYSGSDSDTGRGSDSVSNYDSDSHSDSDRDGLVSYDKHFYTTSC